MCVTDSEPVGAERAPSGSTNSKPWRMHCEFLETQMGNPDQELDLGGTSDLTRSGNSFPV